MYPSTLDPSLLVYITYRCRNKSLCSRQHTQLSLSGSIQPHTGTGSCGKNYPDDGQVQHRYNTGREVYTRRSCSRSSHAASHACCLPTPTTIFRFSLVTTTGRLGVYVYIMNNVYQSEQLSFLCVHSRVFLSMCTLESLHLS